MTKRDETASTAAPPRLDAGEVVRIAARAFERDRYLAALLAPRTLRDDLIAIAAFAGEIGRIPTMVSEPMIGRIRLQWWRDVIDAGDRATGNPVADALNTSTARHTLPRECAPPVTSFLPLLTTIPERLHLPLIILCVFAL